MDLTEINREYNNKITPAEKLQRLKRKKSFHSAVKRMLVKTLDDRFLLKQATKERDEIIFHAKKQRMLESINRFLIQKSVVYKNYLV